MWLDRTRHRFQCNFEQKRQITRIQMASTNNPQKKNLKRDMTGARYES